MCVTPFLYKWSLSVMRRGFGIWILCKVEAWENSRSAQMSNNSTRKKLGKAIECERFNIFFTTFAHINLADFVQIIQIKSASVKVCSLNLAMLKVMYAMPGKVVIAFLKILKINSAVHSSARPSHPSLWFIQLCSNCDSKESAPRVRESDSRIRNWNLKF